MNLSHYSKAIAAALAFVGVILSSGLLTGSAQAWASAIVAAVGAALVYFVPNEQTPSPLPPVDGPPE